MRTGRQRWPATVARWTVGVALVSWRYLWEITPLHRWAGSGTAADLPPPLPRRCTGPGSQPAEQGTGPLFHRLFAVDMDGGPVPAAELIGCIATDLNRAVPSEVTAVEGTAADDGAEMRAGQEMVVRIPGPWDGPVQVVHRTDTSFRLATLAGHLEAGQIEFRASQHPDGLRFEIETWARPSSRLVNLLYTHARLAKEVQLNMWVRCCLAATRLAGARPRNGVHIPPASSNTPTRRARAWRPAAPRRSTAGEPGGVLAERYPAGVGTLDLPSPASHAYPYHFRPVLPSREFTHEWWPMATGADPTSGPVSGPAAAEPSLARRAGQSPVAGFLPWVIYWVVASSPSTWFYGALGAAIAAIVLALPAFGQRRIMALDVVTIVFFVGLTVAGAAAGAADRDVMDTYANPISSGVLALVALASLLFVPFTEQSARQSAPRQFWGTPEFRHVNRVLTAMWGLVFLAIAISGLVAARVLATGDWTNWIIPIALIVVAISVTRHYPDRGSGPDHAG